MPIMRPLVAAAVALTALASCSSSGASVDTTPEPTAAPTLHSVQDIPGIVMIDTDDPWPQYATAKVNEVEAGAGGTSINVNYVTGPDLCSGFAGYAVDRSSSEAAVTVVVGRKASCTGKGTSRTTVLPLTQPLGDLDPTISRYSKAAVPVK